MQFYASFNHIYLFLITINIEVIILATTCNVCATNENLIQHCNALLKSEIFLILVKKTYQIKKLYGLATYW